MNTQGTSAWSGFTKTDDFSLASYETQPRACTLSADGTYFYVVGDQGHSVDQFTMSTPYDLTTISHTRVQALGTSNPRGIYFKEDGTKMFVSYYGGTIKRYSLSTAWDVSTIGSADQSDTFEGSSANDSNSVIGLYFKPDGTKFYTVVASDNAIKEYTCGSAWDVSSMSGSPTATRDSLQADPSGVFISSDGLRLWYSEYNTDKVYQWNLSTAWDISTGSIDSTSYSVEANPFGFTMKTDGTKFYIVNDGQDEIQEFTGGKSCPNDFSATSDLEAMTNLPTNTIFLQTDDTPTYWWYNGTSWVLSGDTLCNTDMTTSYTGYTGDTGSFEYNSSENGIEVIATTKNKIIVKTLSTTLSKSGKWVARFKVTRLSGDVGDGWGMGFTSSSTSSVSQIQAGGYAYGIAFYVNNGSSGGNANTVSAGKNGTGGNDGSSSGNITTDFSEGDTLYVEIRHISQTSFECNVFSDSGFSTKTGSVTRTLSEQDYDYDQLSFWTKWGTNRKDGLFEDLEVQKGTSEWLE